MGERVTQGNKALTLSLFAVGGLYKFCDITTYTIYCKTALRDCC